MAEELPENYVRLSGEVSGRAEAKYLDDGRFCIDFKLSVDAPHITSEMDETKRRATKYRIVKIHPANIDKERLSRIMKHLNIPNVKIIVVGELYTRYWKSGANWLSETSILAKQITSKK